MRTRAKRIALFLGLGSLSAVLVSWALSLGLWPSMEPLRIASTATESGVRVNILRRDSFGVLSLSAITFADGVVIPQDLRTSLEEALPSWAQHELLGWAHADPLPLRGPEASRFMLVSGWPFPCMWTSFIEQPLSGYCWYKARNGIVLGPAPPTPDFHASFSPRERVLPTRVVWPAFIGCSLFWAAVWASLVLAPPTLRRTIRRRRGRCAACGYDRTSLATTARCPECGHVP